VPPARANGPEASHPERKLQMHQETTTRPSAVPIRSGIVTLSGYGIKVAVDRRHLSVSDGIVSIPLDTPGEPTFRATSTQDEDGSPH
jgi:hypothetical protein